MKIKLQVVKPLSDLSSGKFNRRFSPPPAA
jgi:hypothetical protein